MSYFMQSGDDFTPTPGKESVLENLPTGNYVITQSPMGLYYTRVPKFDLPPKLYGNINDRADRIIRTFLDRPRATGVLLAGEKGSGKSQLARLISYKGYDMDIPTILVNAPYSGDAFSSLLADVEQPAIVVMDEFEKTYNRSEHQEAVLTLLDGTMTSKKLFILTVNDKWRVTEHMKNRPGRLFYALDFDGLDSQFVREYVEDELLNQDHTDTLVRLSAIFTKFNFDMLKSIVEEMNRYDEDPYQVLEYLNANPVAAEKYDKYKVRTWDPTGKELISTETYSETPITEGQMHVFAIIPNDDDGDVDDTIDKVLRSVRGGRNDNSMHLLFNAADVTKLNAEEGVFEFTNDDSFKALFTRQKAVTYHLSDLAY